MKKFYAALVGLILALLACAEPNDINVWQQDIHLISIRPNLDGSVHYTFVLPFRNLQRTSNPGLQLKGEQQIRLISVEPKNGEYFIWELDTVNADVNLFFSYGYYSYDQLGNVKWQNQNEWVNSKYELVVGSQRLIGLTLRDGALHQVVLNNLTKLTAVIEASALEVRAGQIVYFSSLRSTPGALIGAIINFRFWDFNDGQTATGDSVNHVYQKPGKYYVNLTVKDSLNNSNNATVIINVLPKNFVPNALAGSTDDFKAVINATQDSVIFYFPDYGKPFYWGTLFGETGPWYFLDAKSLADYDNLASIVLPWVDNRRYNFVYDGYYSSIIGSGSNVTQVNGAKWEIVKTNPFWDPKLGSGMVSVVVSKSGLNK